MSGVPLIAHQASCGAPPTVCLPPPRFVSPQVVPYLKRDGLKWKLEGRHAARQALLTSGLLPTLAAPTPSGEQLGVVRLAGLETNPVRALLRKCALLYVLRQEPDFHPACCCARQTARQLTHPCCRPPVCAAAGEGLIEEAVQLALSNGWVKPLDHVVVLSRSQMDEFMVKVGGRPHCY